MFYSLLPIASQASMDKIDFQTELSRNSMNNKYGLGAKYDFGAIGAESLIFVDDNSNIEFGSYLSFDYGLSDVYDITYGLGYFKSEGNSGLQSKLELSYKLSDSTKIYSYFSLRQGGNNSDINTWVGLGIRWTPFKIHNSIVSLQESDQRSNVIHKKNTSYIEKEKVIASINNIEIPRKVKVLQYGAFNADLDKGGIHWLHNISRKFFDKPLAVYEFVPGSPVLATLCEMNSSCIFDEELFTFFDRYSPFVTTRTIKDDTVIMEIKDYISNYKK